MESPPTHPLPLDGTATPSGRPRRRWLVGAAILGAAALIAGGYAAFAAYADERLPRIASVDGVPLGGLTREEALVRAQEAANARLDRPLRLHGPDGWSTVLTPASAGFALDPEAAIRDIHSPGWSPARVWAWLTAPAVASSPLTVNTEQLAAQVEANTAGLPSSPREPSIHVVGGELVREPGAPGWIVDTAGTALALRTAVELQQGDVDVQAVKATPSVSDEAADRAVASVTALLDRGLTLQRDDVSVPIPRGALARSLAFTVSNGSVQPRVDGVRLRTRLLARFPQLQDPPRDAGFRIRDGRPVIIPARDGRTIAAEDVANAVATAAVAYPDSGAVSVPAVALAPVLTDERASQLGITERISSFTQDFPYAAYRVQNIGQAARYVDGTVLMPGEVFSMNDTIKERTPENGYTEGFVIGPGGVFREDLGGGVSTATTAVWTAAYFAGMEAVQVQAHSIYIPRYAPGLEATVAWGVFDMKFKNSSPNAVLITARTTNTSVTVEFWGTRQFDKVKAVFGPKRDVVPYATVADTSASCLGQEGSSGFTIDVERRFISEREVVRSETTTTTYRPAPRVICA